MGVRNLDPIHTGLYAIVRADTDDYPLKQLTFDEDQRALMLEGEWVKKPYMLIRILATPDRPDFYSIPNVKESYQRMLQQFRESPKDFVANNRAFDTFEVTALLSPDLLIEHATRLAANTRQKFKPFLEEGRRSAPDDRRGGTELAETKKELLETDLEALSPFASVSR